MTPTWRPRTSIEHHYPWSLTDCSPSLGTDQITHWQDGTDIVMYLKHEVEAPGWLAGSGFAGDLVVSSSLWMCPRGQWPGRSDVPAHLLEEDANDDGDIGAGQEEEEEADDDDVRNGLSRSARLRIKAWPVTSIHLCFGLRCPPANGDHDDTEEKPEAFRPHQFASILRSDGMRFA
jgi:hypothetical protein